MPPYDPHPKNPHHCHCGSGHLAHPVPALPAVSRRKAHPESHHLPGQGTGSRRVWSSGGVLSEKCKPAYRKPRSAGAACHRPGGGTASVEAADSSVHRRGHGVLYAAGAILILITKEASGNLRRLLSVSKKSTAANPWLSRMGIPSKCRNTSRRSAKPTLCKGGWHGAAVTGGLYGSSDAITIPQSKIEDFCQLPLHKGAFGCSRTSAFLDVSQKNRETVPHSFFESLGSLRKFPEALFYRNSCPTAMTKGRLTAKATVDSSTDLAHSSGRVSVWMA